MVQLETSVAGFTEKLDRFTIVDRYMSFIEQDKTGFYGIIETHKSMIAECSQRYYQDDVVIWKLTLLLEKLGEKHIDPLDSDTVLFYKLFKLLVQSLLYNMNKNLVYIDQEESQEFFDLLVEDSKKTNGCSYTTLQDIKVISIFYLAINYGLETPIFFPSQSVMDLVITNIVLKREGFFKDPLYSKVLHDFRTAETSKLLIKTFTLSILTKPDDLTEYEEAQNNPQEPESEIEVLTKRMIALEDEVKQMREYIRSKESSWSSKD